MFASFRLSSQEATTKSPRTNRLIFFILFKFFMVQILEPYRLKFSLKPKGMLHGITFCLSIPCLNCVAVFPWLPPPAQKARSGSIPISALVQSMIFRVYTEKVAFLNTLKFGIRYPIDSSLNLIKEASKVICSLKPQG